MCRMQAITQEKNECKNGSSVNQRYGENRQISQFQSYHHVSYEGVITCSGVRRRLMALVVFDLSSMGQNLFPTTFSLNFDFDNWLWTVKTRAIDFLTDPILESLAGAPPVTCATRSYGVHWEVIRWYRLASLLYSWIVSFRRRNANFKTLMKYYVC